MPSGCKPLRRGGAVLRDTGSKQPPADAAEIVGSGSGFRWEKEQLYENSRRKLKQGNPLHRMQARWVFKVPPSQKCHSCGVAMSPEQNMGTLVI